MPRANELGLTANGIPTTPPGIEHQAAPSSTLPVDNEHQRIVDDVVGLKEIRVLEAGPLARLRCRKVQVLSERRVHASPVKLPSNRMHAAMRRRTSGSRSNTYFVSSLRVKMVGGYEINVSLQVVQLQPEGAQNLVNSDLGFPAMWST